MDAVVNPTNESLNDRSRLSLRMHEAAGPELRAEMAKLEGCRTGSSKITKGFQLQARCAPAGRAAAAARPAYRRAPAASYVIHTVGPRYSTKYRTAAEAALFSCYRSTLLLLRDYQLRTLGLTAIHSARRNYPVEEGAHIALRACFAGGPCRRPRVA